MKASDGKWYFKLSDDWYGPFGSQSQAENHLDTYFANPGGWSTDRSGRNAPPSGATRMRNSTNHTPSDSDFHSYKGHSIEVIAFGSFTSFVFGAKVDGVKVVPASHSSETGALKAAKAYVDSKVKNAWILPHKNEEKVSHQGQTILIAQNVKDGTWSWSWDGDDGHASTRAGAIKAAKEFIDHVTKDWND